MFKKLFIAYGLLLSLFWSDKSMASQASMRLPLLYVLNTQQGLTKNTVDFSWIYSKQPFVRVLCVVGSVNDNEAQAYIEALYASYVKEEKAANLSFSRSNKPEVGPEYVFLTSRYKRSLEHWMHQEVPACTGMSLAFALQEKINDAFPVLPMMNANVALLEFHQGNLYSAKKINEPLELYQ